jgi:hypothetical protein
MSAQMRHGLMRQMQQAQQKFQQIFGYAAPHGAAGWQMNGDAFASLTIWNAIRF